MIVLEYQIAPGEYVPLKGRGPRVHLVVFTLDGVRAYLVDQQNLERYKKGQRFEHFGPGPVTTWNKGWTLPFTGPCFVILANATPAPVRVAADLVSLG